MDSLDELKKWINWNKNAKLCPRCKQRVTNLPCPECGYKHKSSMTKPENLEQQTEGELEEVKKFPPLIAAQLAGAVAGAVAGDEEESDEKTKSLNNVNKVPAMAAAGIMGAVTGANTTEDDEDQPKNKALDHLIELLKRGGEQIGSTTTGKPSRMIQSTGSDKDQKKQKIGFDDMVRGHKTNVRSATPSRGGKQAVKPKKQQFGETGTTYQPKFSPLHHMQSKDPEKKVGALRNIETTRNIPTSQSKKPKSGILSRFRKRFKLSAAPSDIKAKLGNVTRKQTKIAETEFKRNPFHKGGKAPIVHTPKTGKVSQTKIPPKSHPQKRVSLRTAKNPYYFRRKDGVGYGNLWTANTMAYGTVEDDTHVGKPAQDPTKQETYIQDKAEKKTGMNKITKTRVGDDIHFYVNGVEDRGIVAKMSTTYITVFKEDGRFYDIPMNDTFHVSEILVNKTWDSMSMEERTEQLQKAHAYSPRFLTKSWADLPQELKDILKSDVEQGAYGTTGGRPFIGVSTQTPFDAEEDYEGQSHDDKSEEFKHEHKKPKTSMTGHGKKD